MCIRDSDSAIDTSVIEFMAHNPMIDELKISSSETEYMDKIPPILEGLPSDVKIRHLILLKKISLVDLIPNFTNMNIDEISCVDQQYFEDEDEEDKDQIENFVQMLPMSLTKLKIGDIPQSSFDILKENLEPRKIKVTARIY